MTIQKLIRENLIKDILNMTLDNCFNDTAYNDNTLHDLILFGFKGLSNMSEQELKHEYDILNNSRGE
jgi:hypothetical protein